MTQFVTSVLSVNSALGIGLSITLTIVIESFHSFAYIIFNSIQLRSDEFPINGVAYGASPPGPISLSFSTVVETIGTIKGMIVVAC